MAWPVFTTKTQEPRTITVTSTQLRGETPTREELLTPVETAIGHTQNYLFNDQKEDGHWVGELVCDVTLVSDVLIYMNWKGEVDFQRQAKVVKHILDEQLPEGGWSIYHDGPSELNATVKAYFALKLAGVSAEEPEMRKAHATILRLGGIPKTNTYNKLMLALFGQYPWKYLPIIPSEIILLPNWMYFNIYEMSSWSRAMVVPLSIINHFKPMRYLPPEKQLHELFPYGTEHSDFSMPWTKQLCTWTNFFLGWDGVLKFFDSLPWKPFRARALEKAEAWMTERMGDNSDGLGAIFPSMMYSIIALKALGYSDDHPILRKAEKDFFDFEVDDLANNDYRFQPCFSPIWDTAINTFALGESGVPKDHPQMVKAGQWMLDREVRIRGDWYVKNPHPENSGWAFEYNNAYYPDVDDTFKVLLALRHVDMPDRENQQEVMDRALRWAISFQCKNGGFAAFDKNVTKPWLEDVPFADHNAILDPPCSDITSRALEYFGRIGLTTKEPFIRKALKYIQSTQGEDGSWSGRWGVNYIYGTWLVLRGLSNMEEIDMNQDWILRGRDWLESCQQEDGGWGESPASYEDSKWKGRGQVTPSQTAWALMGIMSCGDVDRVSVRRGIDYLVRTQLEDGTWDEAPITGTGFPKVFYLKYSMYRINWPLLALADFRRMTMGLQARGA